jgi:hypothetical protein
MIYVVNPQSRYSVTSKKPAQIVSLSSPSKKAAATLPGLLTAFIRMGEIPPGVSLDTLQA